MVATDWSRTASVDAALGQTLHPYPLAERLGF
jgi:hypothetical protein